MAHAAVAATTKHAQPLTNNGHVTITTYPAPISAIQPPQTGLSQLHGEAKLGHCTAHSGSVTGNRIDHGVSYTIGELAISVDVRSGNP